MEIIEAKQQMTDAINTAMKTAEQAMKKECTDSSDMCRLEILSGYAEILLKLSMALDKVRI